jgi:cobalt transporter subunit CbtA
MLRHILLTAVIAGVLAGLAISVVQEITTTPVILHAEEFEQSAAPAVAPSPGATGSKGANESDWAPADGIERTLFTSLANVITGVGFALLLVVCFALYGKEVNGRQGVLWGLAGYAVFSLGPSLGLPPEVPGSLAAELVTRQGWWLAAALATTLGLGLMVFGRNAVWVVVGAVILATPHLYGAPQPDKIGGPVPAELAGHFVAASLVTAAVFWSMLGWLSGTFYRRLS